MAEEKSSQVIHPAKPIFILLAIAIILSTIIMLFEKFLANHPLLSVILETFWLFLQGKATFADLIASTGSPFIATLVLLLKILSLVFSVLMVGAIVWVYRRYNEADSKLREPLKAPKEINYGVEVAPEGYVNPRWLKVLEHVNSQNPSDWRLAILEADIMLGDMLDKMGYAGVSIGDKLKTVEASDFSTLQEAWEAHKVRNAIAHEGSDLVINKPEAERVIRLFEKVFKEFRYI